MSELDLKNKCVRAVKQHHPDVWFYKAHDQFTSGIPDLIFCVNGNFLAIELKVGICKATRIQEFTLKAIQRAGGVSAVCRSVQEVLDLIKIVRG